MDSQMIRIIGLAAIVALSGCAAPAPLVIAGSGVHAIARHDENIKVRSAAALKDEPDLLTYSMQSIGRGKATEAIQTYMLGYDNPDYSTNMKSLALYQIALIYMNRFNDDRDDEKAREYLQRHREEFPNSLLATRIQGHLEILRKRDEAPVTDHAAQLLKEVDREALLAQDLTPYDADLNPMSERAIAEDRTADAEAVYNIVYDNVASGDEMRAKSLYQLGLIFMSPYNKDANRMKALDYLRKANEEFPDSSIREKVAMKITELLNRQN
jgi:hypothetical protein